MLYGNTDQIDITPSLGTLINGEFTTRYANKIADPLFAKAIYMHDGKTKLLIMVVDICVMKRDFLDSLKAGIEQSIGVPASNQLISSTHAHSTGSIADLLMGHIDLAYRNQLAEKLLKLATLVVQKEQKIKIAFGKVLKPDHLTSRRYRMKDSYQPRNPVLKTVDAVKTNPFGYESEIIEPTSIPDPEVCFIGIKNGSDEWIGLLANYGLHYVGDCERGTITADYFGYFSNKIASLLNSNRIVSVMSNGTSGEVNIWDFIDGDRYPKNYHEKSKYIGEDIAEAVFTSINGLSWETEADLEVLYQEISLNKRLISPDLLKESYAILAKTDYEAVAYTDKDLYEKVYAREQVLLESIPQQIFFPVQCFRIGKVLLGGLGGEFFSASGKALKQESDFYFSICLANDYVGYVPPANEFINGGYETWRCRSSFLEENAEEKVIACMLSMIKKLKSNER
ncbi:hypothetical protein [Sphingobacterium sp.]|uniref:hypothetical protein n=1 Tax=Sphingobacterium sp. TaxID=341027 RepID=UPI0028978CD9|nr:hypothetical protein [Sphingobacterium sp.]